MKNKVYFADCLPGFGKTFWAIQRLIQINKAQNGVVIYTAPTHRLLEEVYEKLIESGVKINDIFYIQENGRIPPSARLCMLLTGGSPEQLPCYGCTPEVFPGSIILTTHANLWNCHASDMFLRAQFPTKKDITLIIDEARNCEIRSTKFTLKGQIYLDNFLSILGIDKNIISAYGKYRPVIITKDAIERIRESFGDDIAKKLTFLCSFTQLSKSPSSFLHMYISVKRCGYNVTIQSVMTPFALLTGWKQLFVLSAQFKTSQFYHLINLCQRSQKLSEDQRYLIGGCPNVQLVDISSKVINKERYSLMKARFEQVTFGYLLDNGMSKDRITGYVVKSNKVKYVLKYATEIKKCFIGAYKVALSGLPALMTQPIVKSKWQYNMVQEYRQKILNYLVRYRDKETKELVPVNCITWLSKIADDIAKDWINNPSHRCRIQKEGNYLLGINKTAGRTSVYDKQKPLFEQFIPPSVKAVDISGDVRGLDCYKKYDVVAFFASTRLSPELKMWFNQFCPNYDPELDTMLGTALQTICRCSIRDGEATSKPLVLVTDETCAVGLVVLLEQYFTGYEHKVKILTPSNFGINNTYTIINSLQVDDEQAKEINRRRARLYARLDSTKQQRKEYGKQIKTKARDFYYKSYNKQLYNERDSIKYSISYYKQQNNLDKITQLKKKQKEIAEKLKIVLVPYRKEFNAKWGIDKEFTQDLINKVQQKTGNTENTSTKEYLNSMQVKAKDFYIYGLCNNEELRKKERSLNSLVRYYKNKGDLRKSNDLRAEQKQIADTLKTLIDNSKIEFNAKWGVDEKFTQDLISKMQNCK